MRVPFLPNNIHGFNNSEKLNSCDRWLNCLDPSLNLDAWTKEEDDKLEAAIKQHGYSWSRVAACMLRRTDNQCMR